jgi:hypothetical protein
MRNPVQQPTAADKLTSPRSPSVRGMTGIATPLIALVAILAFTTAPASASLGHRLLSRITEVPPGPGVIKSGQFGGDMTIDAAGDVYTYESNGGQGGDGGIVDEFNSAGAFVTQFVTGAAGGQGKFIAVREATGEVYIGSNPERLHEVYVYSASGQFLGSWNGADTPTHTFDPVTGATPVFADNSTDVEDQAKGDIYVQAGVGVVDVFEPEAGGKEKYLFELSKSLGPVSLATIDQANGDLYVGADGGTDILEPQAGGEYKLLQRFTGFEARAVDDIDGDIYAAAGGGLAEFDSAGAEIGELAGTTAGPLQEPVPFIGISGIAVGANEDVYVSSGGVNVFGPNIIFPDVTTGEFSLPSLQQTSATIEGALNPEEIAGGTGYFFQYGTSEALGSSTSVESAGEGSSEVPVSATLSGLGEDTTYYYRLVVEAEGEHHFGAIDHVTTLPAAPTIYQALETTATVQGTVDTQGLPASYWVEYGPSETYGQDTPEVSVKGSLEGVPIAQIVDELLPSRTYHYRLVSKNALGTSYSPDETFTTAALTPPTVSTDGASGVSQNTATLSGTVGTNSLQTEYGFEISTEPGDYGAPTGLGSLGGALTQVVSVTLGELQPATTYYYRVEASSADGASYGEPGSFTTPGFPTLVTTPASPPLVATPEIAFPAGSLANTGTGAEAKRLTDAEKLAKALQGCHKGRSKAKRASCEKAARKKYAPASKKKGPRSRSR